MFELLLIGAAILFLAKRKSASGIGRPYQTYLRFDEPSPSVDLEEDLQEVLPELPRLDLEQESSKRQDVYDAAESYFVDHEDYSLLHDRKPVDYATTVEAYLWGAETAEEYRWYDLPRADRMAEVDSAATDAASYYKDFDTAYEAFTAGAKYVIGKNSIL